MNRSDILDKAKACVCGDRELYQQANERLNRPGQTNVCRVYHLVMKGTHDERVLASLKNKENGRDAAIEALRREIVKGLEE